METVRIQQNQSERIEAFFQNTATTPLSGLTPTLAIRRQSDDFFWTNTSFTSAFTQVNMSAVNATNQGGYYSYLFDTTGLADDTYSLMASGTGAVNSPQTGEIKAGGFLDRIDKNISDVSSAGGGAIVNLQGVFTQDEKDRLMNLIADNFVELKDFLKSLLDKIIMMDHAMEKLDSKENIKKLEEITNQSKQEILNFLGKIDLYLNGDQKKSLQFLEAKEAIYA